MVERRRLRARPAPTSIDILQCCRDPHLFASHFRERDGWEPWFAFLAALFALPMTEEQLAIYQRHTGRSTPPAAPVHEAWLCCGRRARKSFMLAASATFLACFKDWKPFLGPGELGTIMIVAADRKQARVVKRYITGLLKSSPVLAQLIQGETRETITLANRIVIEIHTCSHRTVRGYLIIAALLDEVGYWPSDENASEPDVEVLNAIKPAMATVPDAILLCASSPHARKGVLWEAHRKHFGKDGDPVLVWQATTRDMNPTVPQSLIDAALEEDPARASAEWLAQFRTDLEAFVSIEAVRACVSSGVYERAPIPGTTYHAFVDPSGGSGTDSMTLCIGHIDHAKQIVAIDAIRERRPPFSPEQVTQEFAAVLRTYNVFKIVGDRYAGGYPPEQFGKFNILFDQCAKPRSDLYQDLLPMINSGRVQLLDNQRLTSQLCALERRNVRSGKPLIDHPPNGHDDLANSVAGLASVNTQYPNYDHDFRGWSDDPNADREAQAARYQRQRLASYIFNLSGGRCWPG